MSDSVSPDQFKAVAIPKSTSARSRTVNQMSHRIVQTYLQATPAEHKLGERFYTQDAHGSARALASGHDPNGPTGKLLRTMPSPGERASEWQHGDTSALPETPARKAFEGKVTQQAGVLARLSPQTSWENNIKQAHEVHSLHQDTVNQLMQGDRSGLKGTTLNNQPSNTIIHAHAIHTGQETPGEAIHGAGEGDEKNRVKVGSFFHNIAQPDTSPHTTVDFRAHDIAAGRLLNTSVNRGLSSKGRYSMFEEAHERAASLINDKHSDRRGQAAPIQPKQVQAVTWWTDKNHQDKAMGGKIKGTDLPAGRAKGGGRIDRNALRTPAGQ